ncbi:MAG: hypothetical protein K1Y02_10180 [Candidatus Hydrogenedentes bacterium]|nr:hypothetical protein [Candidatus Hydrogenedentota bacterium]
MDMAISRRAFLGTGVGVGLGLALGSGPLLAQTVDLSKQRLIIKFDCTQDFPAEVYFGAGDVRVVESPAGKYREAEGKPISRFGYRFKIEHIGRPHAAVIHYPDDKRRFMCINDGTCYDLTTGVFTGWAQPITNTMLELRQVFWPRWEDCSIVFMTWSDGEPAAAATIEIYELDDLPALAVPGDPLDGSRREVGVQYEDPCGIGASEGAMNREEWIERVIQYMRYTGQNLLAYPMAWYEGPQFPSQYEPSDGFHTVIARDRKQYAVWTTNPEDWYAGLFERFEKEGLRFQGGLTLLRLGSLLKGMNIDLEAIKGGAETYNNMTWNDNVQASTNDWTPFYNAINLNIVAEQLKGKPPAPPSSMLPQLAYGERGGPDNHMGAMFNPLHPTVQEAIIRFAREIGQRYSKYPAFDGISFNMFSSCICWYGSIHLGYDDYSIRLFEEETGIQVRVDPKAPDRFSKRYNYLIYACKPAWVEWRCRKIRELFGKIHAALAESRKDLRVAITLWDETTVPGTLGFPTTAHQIGARESMLEFYREAGIDITMYNDEPGLEIDRGMGNPRDRGGHGSGSTAGVNCAIEDLTMYRDFDFLDKPAIDAYYANRQAGAFIFNCWVEAWGNHVWFTPDPNDPNLETVRMIDGKPADGVLQMNSEYPKDGFWWDSQLRITPPFQGGVHFLEPYAQAVADLDACRITRGGLFMDKAHSEQLQQFTRAFRALPRRKFDTRGETTDPVAVRVLVESGMRYIYLVNREYYPVTVDLVFNTLPQGLRNLSTGELVDAKQQWSVELGPYELRVFGATPIVDVLNFAAKAPDEVVAELIAQAKMVTEAFEALRAGDKLIPGMDNLDRGIRAAVEEKRYAWLRRAVTSYIARKAVSLTAGGQGKAQ